MNNILVIVESPSKEKTIQKYLGDKYEVMSSVGHIAKMKTTGKMGLGINFETWEPQYSIDPTKKEIVKNLKRAAKKASQVLIATDPDREGEAIGDNLVSFLAINEKYKRIKYNEITKEAILNAIKNPLLIDENLVKAQKSRRMLDRIIGFRLSKLISSKIVNSPINPSAGRVQSIALKLIVDREKEIEAFVPINYFIIEAKINASTSATLYKKNDKKDWENTWVSQAEAEEIMKELQGNLIINEIKKSKRTEMRATPFKQSVLYKRAALSSSTVQSAMQKLYEGYDDGGLISYPRTDSTRLSETFIAQAKAYVAKKFGEEYVSKSIKGFAGDQNAHEAIRPTDITLTPEDAAKHFPMSATELKVYTLIYNNTIQAVMEPPVKEFLHYKLNNNGHEFRMHYSKVIFDGYYIFTGNDSKNEELPVHKVGDEITVKQYVSEGHETKPPARYNDGSLIEALDEIKVGRPSTFSSTVKIIKDRAYAELEGRALKPTEFGRLVLDILITNFPTIINEKYTSQLESELDQISEGEINYKNVMDNFWDKFNKSIEDSLDKIEKKVIPLESVGEICPEDGSELVYRHNKKNGQRFIACSGFPKCRFLKSDPNAKPTFRRKYPAKKDKEKKAE
ncbi:type I DNA topoisomerase [Mycoplasma iguanae]|uniref:DNA topoisomerase 1 n=1 Tax=Mycoplasma iguanae TaxID=292461 RepID=A0ABY5R7G5_9MOLU|nr:type I DNA topoisomerase [Mycoplasma iguanae]UVD81441.1 type I DNA topoisomerase [Mycoplasma iguanae]